MNGIFITGTDTNIGKTFISAGIAEALKLMKINVGVMKPIATGADKVKNKLISSDAIFLKKHANISDSLSLINPVIFHLPLAPYTASLLENKKIDFIKIKDCLKKINAKHDFIIVEGIGGIMVPLTKNHMVADMIKDINLPLIIVSQLDLGTINHTLLTLDYARKKDIQIKGIIFNHPIPSKSSLAIKTNAQIIKNIGNVEILGEIPYQKKSATMQLGDLFLKNINMEKILN